MKRIALFLVVLVSCFSLTTSCKKAGRVGARVATKKVVQKVMKFALGAALLVSVEEVMAGEMLDMFDEAISDKDPTPIQIHNNHIENLTIEISNNGSFFEKKTINVEDSISFPSTEKGIVTISSGSGYYILEGGKEYAVKSEGDKIIVEEVDRPES